jgi:small-conductance mechanosensitive channel
MMSSEDTLGPVQKALDLRLFDVGSTEVTLGGLLIALVFMAAVGCAASLLEGSLLQITRRYSDEPWRFARIHSLGRLMRYAVWVLGILLGLNYVGIDLTSVALFGGAVAVGLGFGLQNVFSNFVSGLILLLEHSLKVGDFVDLQSGVRGHVREIAMRYTRVTTNDSLDVLVPNSEFVNGRVANWTLEDAHRRMHIPFGVAYGTPKETVRDAALEAARSVPGVIESGGLMTRVWLVGYGESSMNYELVVWADRELSTRPGAAHAALMWALDDALQRHGIPIPLPQRDLHVRSGTLDVRVRREEGDG